MKSANAVLTEETMMPTVQMTVTVDVGSGVGVPSLRVLCIPWDQVTDLVWNIVTPGYQYAPAAVTLPEFFPLRVKSQTATTLTVTFDNTVERQQGPFDFSLLVAPSTGGSFVIHVDPTVENDPPPPRIEEGHHHRKHLKVAGPAVTGGAQ